MTGIYKITSPKNRVYVGQSVNIKSRWSRYKKRLPKSQIKLNRSFLKYGVENHIFEVIEGCLVSELNEKERYWQDFYNVLENGLNCILTETNSKRREYSIEVKLKRSIDATNISEETREKRSKALTGKKNSEETIEKMKGKIFTEEHKSKIGEASKRLSKETRKIISLKKSRIILNLETGIYYTGIEEVANMIGVKKSAMTKRLSGVNTNKTSFIYV